MREFQTALNTFFQMLAQADVQQPGVPPQLPAELANIDQLRVLLDTLPDYDPEDNQPSYVLAIPCRPILVGLSTVLPALPSLANVNWGSVLSHCGDGAVSVVQFPAGCCTPAGTLLPPQT